MSIATRIIRIVGAPATGKTTVRDWLADRLQVPAFGIDDERIALLEPGRWWPRDDTTAWRKLKAKISAVSGCIVETSGGHSNDLVLCRGSATFTVGCVATPATRAARLQQRVLSGHPLAKGQPNYVAKLLKFGPPRLTPHLVVRTDSLRLGSEPSLSLLDRCRAFMEAVA